MATFDCRTPGCTGRISFVAGAQGPGEGPVDQLTGQRLVPADDKPAECPVCHVFWRESHLRHLRDLRDVPGAPPP